MKSIHNRVWYEKTAKKATRSCFPTQAASVWSDDVWLRGTSLFSRVMSNISYLKQHQGSWGWNNKYNIISIGPILIQCFTPSKYDTVAHCWYNAGPPSATLGQHCTKNVSTLCVCGDYVWCITRMYSRCRNCRGILLYDRCLFRNV